jgi:small subunit ribosomal protein S8
MIVNDLISNLIATIKNGLNVRKASVCVPRSRLCINILEILYLEGYIRGFSFIEPYSIEILLKYKDNKSVINDIIRVSKLSKRIYFTYKMLDDKFFQEVLLIISTNEGLLTNREIILTNKKIGGEVLLKII